jgi:hypothetical protein
LAAAVITSDADADLISHGPPAYSIKLSSIAQQKRIVSSNKAIAAVFDFDATSRPEYLNEAYREAGKLEIQGFVRIVSSKIVGDRVFSCAVVDRWVGPQTIGNDYAYFQCIFGVANTVTAVKVL